MTDNWLGFKKARGASEYKIVFMDDVGAANTTVGTGKYPGTGGIDVVVPGLEKVCFAYSQVQSGPYIAQTAMISSNVFKTLIYEDRSGGQIMASGDAVSGVLIVCALVVGE